MSLHRLNEMMCSSPLHTSALRFYILCPHTTTILHNHHYHQLSLTSSSSLSFNHQHPPLSLISSSPLSSPLSFIINLIHYQYHHHHPIIHHFHHQYHPLSSLSSPSLPSSSVIITIPSTPSSSVIITNTHHFKDIMCIKDVAHERQEGI